MTPEPMTPAEALQRVRRILENLEGAGGTVLRKDREALGIVLEMAERGKR